MKPSGFDIIELLKNNYKPEAHAMNKSITQATQDDKQISKSIYQKIFYKILYFLGFESIQCLQKERDPGNRNLSVPVSADFF